jgi:anthranilate phosphoribosyltransferase
MCQLEKPKLNSLGFCRQSFYSPTVLRQLGQRQKLSMESIVNVLGLILLRLLWVGLLLVTILRKRNLANKMGGGGGKIDHG